MTIHSRWDANDIARIIYADYKGIKTKNIAKWLDRSNGSIYSMRYYIQHPELASEKARTAISKGQILETQVRGGLVPDQRKLWDDELSRITNITYKFEIPEFSGKVVKEKPEPVSDKYAWSEPEERPLIDIHITMDNLLTLIKALKG